MNKIICQVADCSLFDTLKCAFDIVDEMAIRVDSVQVNGKMYRFDYDAVAELTKEQEKEYAELFVIQ